MFSFTLESILVHACYGSRKNVIDREAKKQLKLLFLFLEGGVQGGGTSVSMKAASWFMDGQLCTVSLHGRMDEGFPWSLFYRDTNLISCPLPWPTSQRPYLLMPSLWELEFQQEFEGNASVQSGANSHSSWSIPSEKWVTDRPRIPTG